MPPKKWFLLSKKQNRHLNLLAKSLSSFFLFIALIGLIFFLWKGDWFKIEQIVCQQDELPCSVDISDMLLDLKGKNIFFVQPFNLIAKIKDINIEIREIHFKKKLPHKIFFSFINRRPLTAITNDQKNWFLIDDDNFIYKKVFQQPKTLPYILINNNYPLYLKKQIQEEKMLKALLFLKKLKEDFISF